MNFMTWEWQFGKISYDSWGSHESIQTLQRQGYDAELLSVDAPIQPYAALKEAIYDRRLLCYYVPKLEEELLGLQYDAKKNKIDHRPNSSKDFRKQASRRQKFFMDSQYSHN